MTDAAPEGKVRRPVPAAWGDPSYIVNTMLAAGVGIALFCVGYWIVSMAAPRDWNLLLNCYATPVFALPLVVSLFRSGRLGIVGAVIVTVGMTVAHFEATVAAMATYKMGPIEFCFSGDPVKCKADFVREKAAHDPIARASVHEAGPVAGALGAAFSFAFIATLAPGLRDRRRLEVYAMATIGLAALGWLGFFLGRLPEDSMDAPLEWIAKLYLPWQLAFAFAVVMAFKDHQAVRYVRAPG
jgi:hypothetical protein